MPKQGNIINMLVASPSDVQDEREAIKDVVFSWNATHFKKLATIVQPVMWESHSTPIQGDRPQAILNKQLSGCDFLVAVFWTRIGTDTGVAVSGTVEEIDQFLAAKKPVLIYFSNRPVPPNILDNVQMEKLKNYKNELRGKGLQHTYSDIDSFKLKLLQDINTVINDLELPALVPFIIEKNSPMRDNKRQYYETIEGFVHQIVAKWTAEKASHDGDFDAARAIMDQIADQLVAYISIPDFLNDEQRTSLTDLLAKSKQVFKQSIFIGDLGESVNTFWANGDSIVRDLEGFSKQVKITERLKAAPVILTARINYTRNNILHSHPQYIFHLCIKAKNKTRTKITEYKLIVHVPVQLIHSSGQTGKRLLREETGTHAIFEFPNAKENAVTLYPDKEETLGEMMCLIASSQISQRKIIDKESVLVYFYADGIGEIEGNFPVAVLNPFGLQNVTSEQMNIDKVYSLDTTYPVFS